VDTQLPPSKSSSPVSPGEDFERAHPLSPEEECLLSPGSPRSYFQSFGSQAFPDTSPTKPSPDSRYARLAHARRRASHIQSRMFLTASQVWSRAIARAHGSVSFAASIRDIAVILPHVNPPHPMSARNSAPDIMFGTNSNGNGVTPKPSSRSLRMEQDSSRRPQMFASTNSFSLLMRNPTPRYALPSPEGGFEKLLVVEGESRVVFGLGFGPKKGLLGEDTLKTSLDIGKMHTSLGASDKLQELIKSHSDMGEKEDQTQDRKPKWGPRSMPRVSKPRNVRMCH